MSDWYDPSLGTGYAGQPPRVEWWYGHNCEAALAAGRCMLTSPDGRVAAIVRAGASVGDYCTPCGTTAPLQLALLVGRINGTHELWLCGAPWRTTRLRQGGGLPR